MVPEQIYEIVNSITQQALGNTAVTVTDATFVSVGKTILSSETNIDAFYKTLVDRIGRTVIAIREYRADIADIVREPFVYGAILQKLSFQMPQAQENQTWDALSNTPAPNPFEKMNTEIMQVFFDQWSTWEVGSTIPDVQLETAFTNVVQMTAFIDGIFMSMYNSMELAIENNANLARAVSIGSAINYAQVTTTYSSAYLVHVVSDYNKETSSNVSAQAAKTDPNVLKYAAMRMKLVSDQMTKFSTTFNVAGWQRHTPKDRQVFELLSSFESLFETYLQADTFHNDITKLNYYKSVPYWQGSGKAWDFNSVSSIQVEIPIKYKGNVTGSETITETGIIAVIRDIDNCGITVDKRRTKSQYNPKGEYTNYWIKAEIGYFSDNSENCVVFMWD